jgi:hypothetical protein
MIARLIRLLGEASPLAAQIWEGRMKGVEANDACLRKDLRFVIDWADVLRIYFQEVMIKFGQTFPRFWKFEPKVNWKMGHE